MKAIAKRDICQDIKKGDEVEIIPGYTYVLGETKRIDEYFAVKSGEVVIKKVVPKEDKDEVTVIKCKRIDLHLLENKD